MLDKKIKISAKKKIAFFEAEPWEQDYLKKRLKGFELMFFPDILTKGDLAKIKEVEILSPFIYSKINKDLIQSLPKLGLVTTRSTGYDHVDIKAARQAGVLEAMCQLMVKIP